MNSEKYIRPHMLLYRAAQLVAAGFAATVFKRKYIKHPFDFEAVYHETGLIGSLMYGTMSLKATDSTGAVYEYENNRFGHYMIDMDAIYISAHSDLKIDYVKLMKL